MRELLQSAGRIFFALCVFAFFVNIGLLILSHAVLKGSAAFDLQVLSLVNMILLSFVLLRDPNPKKE